MVKVEWNHGSVKETPKDDKFKNAIYISDKEDGIEIGIDDVDTLIEKLQEMKEEWAKKDWIYTLPERFKFVVEIDNTNKFYYATRDRSDENKVVVLWQVTGKDYFDSFTYSIQTVLHHINLKNWIIVEEY